MRVRIRKPKLEKKSVGKHRKATKERKNGALKAALSYEGLSKEIKGYGYDYSFKKFMFQAIVVLMAIVAVSYFYKLSFVYMLVLAVIALLMFPLILRAQFKYLHNSDKFEQLVNYMDQMILSFKQTPKILTALENTYDSTHGEMRTAVGQAIYIIKNDTANSDVYTVALDIIEEKFKCSRIQTLHRFMLTVEKENSVNYQESIDTLYFDIRSWVTRTYQYQAQLAATKKKILIIIGLSLIISAFFAHVLETAENSVGSGYNVEIVSGNTYQVITFLYLALFVFIYTFLNSKLNGRWLVNDLANQKEELLLKYMAFIENFDESSATKKGIIAALFCIPMIAIGVIVDNKLVVILGILAALYMVMKGKSTYNRRKRAIERELVKEFPVWLRDIAINLNNMVVTRAIRESVPTAAPVLRPFLRKFLAKTHKDPISIKPYVTFFEKYDISELSTAVKTLYSIKILNSEESQRQVNDLIQRNQSLLEESEKQKNQDSVAGVSFISMLPMLLLSFKLMADMVLMMGGFFGMMGQA